MLAGHIIYYIGGHNFLTGGHSLVAEYYNTKKMRWYDAFKFSVENTTFASVDSVLLRVPVTNRNFSCLSLAMQGKWILW